MYLCQVDSFSNALDTCNRHLKRLFLFFFQFQTFRCWLMLAGYTIQIARTRLWSSWCYAVQWRNWLYQASVPEGGFRWLLPRLCYELAENYPKCYHYFYQLWDDQSIHAPAPAPLIKHLKPAKFNWDWDSDIIVNLVARLMAGYLVALPFAHYWRSGGC